MTDNHWVTGRKAAACVHGSPCSERDCPEYGRFDPPHATDHDLTPEQEALAEALHSTDGIVTSSRGYTTTEHIEKCAEIAPRLLAALAERGYIVRPIDEGETEPCPTCMQPVPIPQRGDHDYGIPLVARGDLDAAWDGIDDG